MTLRINFLHRLLNGRGSKNRTELVHARTRSGRSGDVDLGVVSHPHPYQDDRLSVRFIYVDLSMAFWLPVILTNKLVSSM